MADRNDGGSAFPYPEDRDLNNAQVRAGSDGMTLRDWFAGQALVGLVSQGKDIKLLAPPSGSDNLSEMCAKSAYLIADCMLAERAK